jgi:hypothetical protein
MMWGKGLDATQADGSESIADPQFYRVYVPTTPSLFVKNAATFTALIRAPRTVPATSRHFGPTLAWRQVPVLR